MAIAVAWEARWVRWPDFGLPADPAAAAGALREAWERAAAERVEIACAGGYGRTGTALACLAVLDGLPARRRSPMSAGTTRPAPSRHPGNATS